MQNYFPLFLLLTFIFSSSAQQTDSNAKNALGKSQPVLKVVANGQQTVSVKKSVEAIEDSKAKETLKTPSDTTALISSKKF